MLVAFTKVVARSRRAIVDRLLPFDLFYLRMLISKTVSTSALDVLHFMHVTPVIAPRT